MSINNFKQFYAMKNKIIPRDTVCGIYKITEKIPTGDRDYCRVYIGQSIDIANRWTNYIGIACGNNNEIKHFTLALKKYGLEHFNFEIVEECDKEDLDWREAWWILKYPKHQLFNDITFGFYDAVNHKPINHEFNENFNTYEDLLKWAESKGLQIKKTFPNQVEYQWDENLDIQELAELNNVSISSIVHYKHKRKLKCMSKSRKDYFERLKNENINKYKWYENLNIQELADLNKVSVSTMALHKHTYNLKCIDRVPDHGFKGDEYKIDSSLTITENAKLNNVTRSSIRRFCQRFNFKTAQYVVPMDELDWNESLTIDELAELNECGREKIYKYAIWNDLIYKGIRKDNSGKRLGTLIKSIELNDCAYKKGTKELKVETIKQLKKYGLENSTK